jgi:hypothetical protein
MICARLREAGIEAVGKGGALSADARDVGPQDIYVEERDLDRAREVLGTDEGVSEEELIQAEEEDAARRRLS